MRLPVKKCLAVLDTNIVYVSSEDMSHEFLPKNSFNNFWEWIVSNSIKDICLFVMPDIIVNEIAKQKYDHNNSQRSKYYEYAKFFGIEPEVSEQNFEDHYSYINGFIQGVGITVTPHPSDIENIIHRAVHKKRPFTGQTGASDKGFKDAVMLHSLLEIENLSDFDKIFWLTKNSLDFTKDVEAEVDTLIIFNSDDATEKFKRYITDHYSWEQQIVRFLETNKTEILTYINDIDGYNFTNFTYNTAEFRLDVKNNVIEFSVNAVADGLNSLDFLLFFDLRANTLTEDPSDPDEDAETEGV